MEEEVREQVRNGRRGTGERDEGENGKEDGRNGGMNEVRQKAVGRKDGWKKKREEGRTVGKKSVRIREREKGSKK